MSYFRDNIDAMSAYVPGEQPAEGESAKVIKLNTNENPYPPSPKAVAVLRQFDGELLRRYPHPTADRFAQAASKVLGVPADWVLPGNGSDELITMIARACASGDGPVVYPTPTFEFHLTPACTPPPGPVEVPFDEDFNLPVEALAAANGAVTFIANPNSPSGTAVACDRLAQLAERLRGLLVIDEAYADFADADGVELLNKYDNVVLLRSMSKGYSLAGLRLGFAVARPAVIEGLLKVKDIYNVGALACAVGAAALDDQPYKIANAEKVKASRRKLAGQLEAMSFKVWASQANFIMVRPPGPPAPSAEEIYERLKARGILIRYFKGPALADKLRITVGTDRQNDALLTAIREVVD